MWDGNGIELPFDVALDLTRYIGSWVAVDMLDASTTPKTVVKSASVGTYDATTGVTRVTVTIAPADFDGAPSTYHHELAVTFGGVPLTVAAGSLYVHESVVS